jgi:hypothetical protein
MSCRAADELPTGIPGHAPGWSASGTPEPQSDRGGHQGGAPELVLTTDVAIAGTVASGLPPLDTAAKANDPSHDWHASPEHDAELAQRIAASLVAAGNARDAVAHARDLAAKARDRAAELRDRDVGGLRTPPAGEDRAVTGAEILLRAARYRSDAAADRAAAAHIRANSAADRAQAAHDREQAARDRAQAAVDRQALLEQLRSMRAAALNGRPRSASGLVDLDTALERARRASGPLVVASVCVPAGPVLREGDDERHLGHAVLAIRRHLRGSDLIVRLANDELLCVMFGVTAENASDRFALVAAELSAQPNPCTISVSLVAVAPGDGLDELLRSPDAAC